jgi:hypothetical protein
VHIVLANHNLTGEEINSSSVFLPEILQLLSDWVRPVFPVSVETNSGHAPQYLLNRLDDGWLVTVGNHYPGDWSGEVRLDLEGDWEVQELWEEQDVSAACGEQVTFAAQVPAWSFRVYRVQPR